VAKGSGQAFPSKGDFVAHRYRSRRAQFVAQLPRDNALAAAAIRVERTRFRDHSAARSQRPLPVQGDEPMVVFPNPMRSMPKSIRSTSVPKGMQATNDAITTLTDSFCREHMDEDYRALAQRMAAALCRKRPSPLASGQPRTWACGIVYVLGQINFLTDPSAQPFMTTADLCARFGVGQSTASAKARVITQALDTSRLNPEWSLPSLLDQNPLVWMAEVNGFLADLRNMPREVQQIAFDKGMIPYIPADREKDLS
jgi:hypothetical protein